MKLLHSYTQSREDEQQRNASLITLKSDWQKCTTYPIRNIRNLLREHVAAFIVGSAAASEASLTFESNVYLYFLSAREQDGCRVRLLRSHQISSPPFTLRHSARVTGKSCVSKTPNLEGQEVSFHGKDFFRFVTLVEVWEPEQTADT